MTNNKKSPLFKETFEQKKDSKNYYNNQSFSKERILQENPPIEFYTNEEFSIKHPEGFNGNVMVQCPFHDDKHPSMSINLRTGAFKCFACEAKGSNIIDYYMLKNSLSFYEALKELSTKKGGVR
ncbi:CHC2 zinc finger domain-containing protein [Pseudomonadota bacterium]